MRRCLSYETSAKKSYLEKNIAMIQTHLVSDIAPDLYKIIHMVIDCKDSTKLHNTIDFKEAKELLENGADVNKKNQWGETPLHLAISEGRGYPFIKLLLDHGADVNSCCSLGRTSLHCALKEGGNFDKNIINLLLINGADIDVNSRAFFANCIRRMPNGTEKWFDKGDIALTKSLIKITLLYGFSTGYCKRIKSVFCNKLSHCPEIVQFTEACIKEVLRLREEKLFDDCTLFDIAISEPEEFKIVPLKLQKYIPIKYPLYYDIIKDKYRRYMRRVVLFKVLQSAGMVIVSETSNKEIYVDYHCLSMICENLVNNDVGNFVKAIFDQKTLNEKLELIDI